MVEQQILGLFDEVGTAADAIEQLRGIGVSDEKITVMSGSPYRPEMLGRPRIRTRLPLATGIGVILGLITAAFLTVGIFLLYPLRQGGQPIVPIPPSLIIVFEVTMLGTMWGTFAGFVIVGRFPRLRDDVYDPRITEGKIGVLAEVNETAVNDVDRALQGATQLKHVPFPAPTSLYRWFMFMGAVLVILGVGLAVTLAFTYDIIRIPFPTNMAEQDSVGYEQGPRLAAPPEAVPVQGPATIAGQPASEPVPADANSIQRGHVFFSINCALCHGDDGTGKGRMSSFFSPGPANLTSPAIQGLSDNELFMVITDGFGPMPSLAENLLPEDRWDVINYMRTLKK